MATFDCLGDVLDYLLDDAYPNGEREDAREDDHDTDDTNPFQYDGPFFTDPQCAPDVDDLAPGDREVWGDIPF